jgi:hypothetical protein
MIKYLSFLLTVAYVCITSVMAQDADQSLPASASEEIQFTPPSNWHLAEKDKLPGSVKVMVVGEGKHEFPPSINLGVESFEGSLKDYLKMIQGINAARHTEWKDLGTIHTEAGNASLSQVDMPTQWGDVRLMHVILMHDGAAYILTAAALKEEFPAYYKDFFKSMTSLKFVPKAGS